MTTAAPEKKRDALLIDAETEVFDRINGALTALIELLEAKRRIVRELAGRDATDATRAHADTHNARLHALTISRLIADKLEDYPQAWDTWAFGVTAIQKDPQLTHDLRGRVCERLSDVFYAGYRLTEAE